MHEHSHGCGLSGAMVAILVLVIGLVVLFARLAWAPWADDDSIAPGQGGADTPVPGRQTTPQTTPSGPGSRRS